MKSTDRERFAKCIGALAEAYPNTKPITTATIQAYDLALGELPIEIVERAALQLMRISKFMPSAAEIREVATSGGMSREDRCNRAWQVLVAALRRYGYDKTIVFDDPALTATVHAMGGLKRLCKIPDDEFYKWSHKDFDSIYGGFVDSPPSLEAAAPLVGQFDRDNQLNGFFDAVKPPMVIKTKLPAIPGAPEVRTLLAHRRAEDTPRVELKRMPPPGKDTQPQNSSAD